MTRLDPGGFRSTQAQIAEESTQGEIPADPELNEIAATLVSVEYEGIGPEQVERPAIGENVADLAAGVSEPSVSITYEMSRWFYDNSGNPDDLAGYAVNRVAGKPYSSLAIAHDIELGDNGAGVFIQPEATVAAREGSTSDPSPKATVRKAVLTGVEVEEATPTGDPTEGVWVVEASVSAEDYRVYQFDQPTSSQTLDVASTDSEDTDLHVMVESGEGTTETIQLDSTDATTATTGAESFPAIENIAVFEDDSGSPGARSHDHVGDITVKGSTGTELLAVLHGTGSHEVSSAASGTILVGSGSENSAPTDAFRPHNLTVERPTGESITPEGDVASAELSLGVDMTRTPTDGVQQRTYPGLITPELSATFDGETAVLQLADEMRRSVATDTVLDFDGSGDYTITLPSAKVTEAGESQSAGENSAENEVTFRGQSMPTVSNAPN